MKNIIERNAPRPSCQKWLFDLIVNNPNETAFIIMQAIGAIEKKKNSTLQAIDILVTEYGIPLVNILDSLHGYREKLYDTETLAKILRERGFNLSEVAEFLSDYYSKFSFVSLCCVLKEVFNPSVEELFEAIYPSIADTDFYTSFFVAFKKDINDKEFRQEFLKAYDKISKKEREDMKKASNARDELQKSIKSCILKNI